MRRHPARHTARAALGCALVMASTVGVGCGSTHGDPRATPGTLTVEAAFAPLVWLTEQIGGPHVRVRDLTAAGVEPHDLELSPRDVARIADADLTVYLSGFQPAVDAAITSSGTRDAVDVADAARLHTADGHDGHTSSGTDPHFWLDPMRMVSVARTVAEALIARAPAQETTFRANLADVESRLRTLDADFTTGLRSCASRHLVTSHESFGYLAARYDLAQIGITGIDPEAEPSATALAEAADFVTRHGITTIYVEPAASPAIGETLAAETGATTAVLDPIESFTEASGHDYLTAMRRNLTTLRAGQRCR